MYLLSSNSSQTPPPNYESGNDLISSHLRRSLTSLTVILHKLFRRQSSPHPRPKTNGLADILNAKKSFSKLRLLDNVFDVKLSRVAGDKLGRL